MTGKENGTPEVIDKRKLSPKDFNSLENLLESYLSNFKGKDYPVFAVIGIAGPVKNNEILGLVNIPHWPKSNGDELAKKLGLKRLVFLNDFKCNGFGIQTKLKYNVDYILINDVPGENGGAKAILGPGTGLGMGFLVKDEDFKYYVIGSSEGGHQDFSPKNEVYFQLQEFTKKLLNLEFISIERMLSGQALIPMYKFLLSKDPNSIRDGELAKKIDGFNEFSQGKKVNEINIELVSKGLNGSCNLSRKVLEMFIGIFGEAAGDLALYSMPTNGIYLVGGLSVALEPLIKSTNIFMEHFLSKDNYAFLLKTFPVYLVKNDNLGMIGAAECARRLIEDDEELQED